MTAKAASAARGQDDVQSAEVDALYDRFCGAVADRADEVRRVMGSTRDHFESEALTHLQLLSRMVDLRVPLAE